MAVGVERSGGHQAVQVKVLGKGLAPGVQDERGGNVAAEPARVGAELDERCGGGSEQHAVDLRPDCLGRACSTCAAA
jgi:hypothetical protein